SPGSRGSFLCGDQTAALREWPLPPAAEAAWSCAQRRRAAPQAAFAHAARQKFPPAKPLPRTEMRLSKEISSSSQSSEPLDHLNGNSGKAYFYTLPRVFQTKIAPRTQMRKSKPSVLEPKILFESQISNLKSQAC